MNHVPLIYIHFGWKAYLSYTFDIARKFNPDLPIILLGDSNNKPRVGPTIKHVNFSRYDNKVELQLFNSQFVLIRGGKRYTEYTKEALRAREFERFCFARWFYLYYYLMEYKHESCWYFDSDTWILTDLQRQLPKYQHLDCTEQSNGTNCKGYITREFLAKYILDVNRMFSDESFLSKVQSELVSYPSWSFCDMRAYSAFKMKTELNTVPLFKVINQETFDDALMQERDCEMEFVPQLQKNIKKLYYINNNLFIRNSGDQSLVKLNCINLSWLPDFYTKYIATYIQTGRRLSNNHIAISSIPYRLKLLAKALVDSLRTWNQR